MFDDNGGAVLGMTGVRNERVEETAGSKGYAEHGATFCRLTLRDIG